MLHRFTTSLTAALVGVFFVGPAALAQGVDCLNVPTMAGAVPAEYAVCAQPSEEATHVGPTDMAFGYNAASAVFQTFQQDTPGTLIDVGPYTPPSAAFLNAGDFEGDDFTTWYSIDNLGAAVATNTATGATTSLGTIVAPTGGFTDMTWDYATGQFYALSGDCNVANNTLSVIDFDALTATPVGAADATMTCSIGLGSDPLTGQLYAFDLVANALFSIDKTTGQSTLIGDLGYDANFGQGMDFDNDDGTCYIYAFNNVTFVAELRTCDTSTGMTTLVGTLGVGLQQFGAASSMTEIVPVELTSFTATASGQGVNLTWATASETNNAGFEVQMKSGQTWSPVAFVDGHGTTTEAQTYSHTVADLGAGTHVFRLKQIDFDGAFEYSHEVEATVGVVGTHVLSAAYPNPFNPQATFDLSVAQDQHVTAALYNALGQRVATLFDGTLEANQTSTLQIDGSGLASGLYVVRVQGERFADALRVTLLK